MAVAKRAAVSAAYPQPLPLLPTELIERNLVEQGRMTEMRRYSATVAYPFASLERATSALRGALRLRMTSDQRPDWLSLEVTGPEERVDARGNVWFEYRGTVFCL